MCAAWAVVVSLTALVVLMAVCARASAAPMAGVQTHVLWSDVTMEEMDRQLDAVKASGAGITRVDVGWDTLEQSGKGRYEDWYLRRMDALVEKAQARGIRLLITFWKTPCWASRAPEDLKQGCTGDWWNRGVERYGPENPQDYADALAFLVRRYAGRVAAWEVWNEPNSQAYLRTVDAVTTYAGLLKAAYPVAKQADPSAQIIGGSLANADFAFAEKLYAQGVKGYFDAFSVHPYTGDLSPLDPRGGRSPYSFVSGVPAVRETMLRFGDDKPIWLTEFGWSTSEARGGRSWENGVDETTQAANLRAAIRQMRSWSYVAVGVWFNLQDRGADRRDIVDNYGLLRTDGSPKPAYAALTQAAEELARGPLPERPLSAPASASGTKARAKVVLRVSRSGSRIKLRGTGPSRRRLVIRFFPSRSAPMARAAASPYRVKIRVDARGRFYRRIKARGLREGRWRVVATAGSRATAARATMR